MFIRKSFVLMLGVLIVQTSMHSLASTPIQIGETQKISSSILNENRELQVYLPSTYDRYSHQKYPVIYLLDSESNFHYLIGFIEKLSKSPYPSIPEMIVVGIVNTDRSRDLTPTKQNTSANDGRVIEGKTGGNMEFFKFLETEVMPNIEKRYRTSGLNVLIGHSFGGITALNHMLNGSRNIQGYIVHDPSIWWDNQIMLKRFEALKGKDFNHKKLFLTQVGFDEKTDSLDNHYNGIQRFNQFISQQPFKNFSYKYMQYDGENHGSVPIKGNLDGLRYIFDGIQINIKDIPDNPDLVKIHYSQLSQNLGFAIYPSESYLDTVLDYLKRLDNPKIVQQFQDYIISIYPHRKSKTTS